jgi:putative FMN-dependent luciferase-like monooxygenase
MEKPCTGVHLMTASLTANRHSEHPFRLGVFTRLVDLVSPAEIYQRGMTLIQIAESLGFETAWVAQHHAHFDGGLPSPLVFLASAAARTTSITLVTGIIILPLEQPLRVAEDAAVVAALSGGRLELGFGTGGNDLVFSLFGRRLDERQQDYERGFLSMRDALDGKPLVPNGPRLFPPAPGLVATIWEAAMSMPSAIRAGEHGSRLLLARTALRTAASEGQPLGDAQAPFVETYLDHYRGVESPPRIGLSRSIYVAPTRAEAVADAEPGIRRHAEILAQRTGQRSDLSIEELLQRQDVHIGTPDDVIASLIVDSLLDRATDLILQVHPVDPSPEKTLRSLRTIAAEVAPALRAHVNSRHQRSVTA